MEGVLSGSTGAGAASGEWTVHVGPDSAVLPLQGPLGGGSAMLSGHLDFGGGNTGPSGSIDVTMAANK